MEARQLTSASRNHDRRPESTSGPPAPPAAVDAPAQSWMGPIPGLVSLNASPSRYYESTAGPGAAPAHTPPIRRLLVRRCNGTVDKEVFEAETADLRSKFTDDELAPFKPLLDKACEVADTPRRQAAIKAIEEQVSSQKSNVQLVAKLKENNPNLKEKPIAEKAKPDIKVPSVPQGLTPDEFTQVQVFIRDFLKMQGITDAEGFVTGSRVTGATFNPGKKEKFGKKILDFSDRDLDSTLILKEKLPYAQEKQLQQTFKERFKLDLGIRQVVDPRQLKFLPVYGKIELNLKDT